ncbi:hypothetical protein B0H17DRAFT_648539 [Mycena rosella]|uniref:Uncharacterized protein n=1 Tax=Mycena rosella TaxID=1033263 RepID=A0AAD7DDN9_MYCRO|nr:hypothetical protein B0H17DRAFT_648539 [Mycena rosella]
MHHNSGIPIVSQRACYLPPRNPIDSPMGMVDATTLLLLQKMMADAQEHGRVVWNENKARCALTGEQESEDLPCGPNDSQKKIQAWLVSAGLLEAEDSDEATDDEADESTPPNSPSSPETPTRRPWHRRLEIVIPSKASPQSASEPALRSPRSPLSPIKLWSAVQRGTSSIPIPTVRLRPKHAAADPSSPPVATPRRKKCRSLDSAPVAGPSRPEAADPADSVLATAFKRAALLGTITHDDADKIMRRHREPLPESHFHAPSWFIPAHAPPPTPTPTLPKIRAPPRPKHDPRFDPPSSYRWLAPAPPPPPPAATVFPPARGEIPCDNLRWYHPFILVILWHVFVLTFCTYAVLRFVLKPLLCCIVLYYTIFLLGVFVAFLI